MATTHPDLAAEWSERNYPLMPDEVNAKSRHNVWWKCKTCGNEWKSVINARVKGTVCPVCADRAVLAGYNDLATTDRKLLAEWDYEKNSLLPAQVSRRSMKSVWWKCSLGHSWKAKISDRTIIGEKCTVCENEYRSVFPGLAVAYYANQKGLKVQLGSDKLLGIPLETYIPPEKLAIEFTNGSEQMEVLKSHLCKQRNIKLVKLPFKTTETEAEYADRVKAVFKSVHISTTQIILSGVLTLLLKAKTTAISVITAVGIISFMTNAPRSKERGAGMSNSSEKKKRYDIPLWCKPNLSIEEAAAYSGIGMGKLYEMTESQDCPFVLWIGSRRMIKRKVFDEFIERQYSI